MKNRIFILLSLLFVVVFTSCEDFLDVNTSKDSPTVITVDQALPPMCFYAAQMVYDHAEYGVYLSQALTTAGKAQRNEYAYSSGWDFLNMNRHPQWRRHFYDLGINIERMIEASKKIDSKNFELVGRTIRLQSTMFTTDVFGDMPRKAAYKSSSPAYDTQESIYEWMFEEADELVNLYGQDEWANNPSHVPISEKMDRIYKGDMKKWAAFTKALRARLWLRKLPNWENTPEVCNKIIAMVDEILEDPNWEEPRYYYPGGTQEQNCPWGPFAPIINAWESRGNRLATSVPTKFFAYAILGAYDSPNANRRFALDPRAEKLMTPRDIPNSTTSTAGGTPSNGPSQYVVLRYLESNIGMPTTIPNPNGGTAISMKVTFYPDLYASLAQQKAPYTSNTGHIALMTQEELMFIKAEAQYWAGDKAAAFNTTKAAVLHNMVRLGVTASDGSDLPAGNTKTRFERYFEVRLPGESEFTIAQLMQQKYVAMYLQPEQWNDMRRYNYSSKSNGIKYDNVPVYTVLGIHSGSGSSYLVSDFKDTRGNWREYSLRRPFNLYESQWMQPDAFGVNAELSPNAWIMRLNYDPETEDRYSKKELERLGAFKNVEWMKKRMIWGYNKSGKASSDDPQIVWK